MFLAKFCPSLPIIWKLFWVSGVASLGAMVMNGRGGLRVLFVSFTKGPGSLSISVYSKPTHTDQYLQWDSHHHLSAKFSVIQTLSHRTSTVCSNPELLQKEKEHLRKALTKCNYPKWALNKVEKRLNKYSRQVNDRGNHNAQSANQGVPSKGHIVHTLHTRSL